MAKRHRTTTSSSTPTTIPPLPKGITPRDLTRPKYDATGDDALARDLDYTEREFELWMVSSFGWVIPTLAIARGGQRTYAVAVGEGGNRDITRGAQVRVGMGPHVLSQHVVYVRAGRVEALRPYLDLRTQGAVSAHTTRDRISSRRAQGAVERAAGNRYWRWDV